MPDELRHDALQIDFLDLSAIGYPFHRNQLCLHEKSLRPTGKTVVNDKTVSGIFWKHRYEYYKPLK